MDRYRSIPMPAPVEVALRQLEERMSSTEPLEGPVLFLLARATQRRAILVTGEWAAVAALWLALASLPEGEVIHLGRTANPLPFSPRSLTSQTSLDPDARYDLIVMAGRSERAAGVLARSLAPDGYLIEGGEPARRIGEAASDPAWRVVSTAAMTIAGPGARPPRFAESARERLLALLLNVSQPGTVVLGPNVVFDGGAKPPTSKISFSGTGGQVGAGDWLIVHPADLDRFSPLPGAVALLLGQPEGEIAAPHACVTLPGDGEEEQLTIVVALNDDRDRQRQETQLDR